MESVDLVDCAAADRACDVINTSNDCVRTPLLRNVEELGLVEKSDGLQVHLKLESMQCTGEYSDKCFDARQFFPVSICGSSESCGKYCKKLLTHFKENFQVRFRRHQSYHCCYEIKI